MEDKPRNTRDAFGNQLQVGDMVYFPKNFGGGFVELRRGTVTHFTKFKIGVRWEKASQDDELGIPLEFHHVAKIFAGKDN